MQHIVVYYDGPRADGQTGTGYLLCVIPDPPIFSPFFLFLFSIFFPIELFLLERPAFDWVRIRVHIYTRDSGSSSQLNSPVLHRRTLRSSPATNAPACAERTFIRWVIKVACRLLP